MDDGLLDVILGRIDGDSTLSEGATDLLLAACRGDDALAAAVGGDPPDRPPARPDDERRKAPVGAFLSSITVEGFRGIGPARTLSFHPGRGLTVVMGRNGSGKSSFAEALEVLLTETTARFQTYAVFKDGWRNLHQAHPTRVAAELHAEGAPGATVVERTWAEGAELGDSSVRVQVAGERAAAGLDRLGWADDLHTYKPFLAHTDLEAMFGGKPSDLYDRLAAVLGLGDLTAAQDRLRRQRRDLDEAAKAAERERRQIVADLAGLDDERAARCRDLLDSRTPDLDTAGALVTGGAPPSAGGELDVLRQLANLVAPDPAAVEDAHRLLTEAAAQLDAVAGTQAARAKAIADLLDQAVRFHERHPAEADCPVCGRPSALDEPWRDRAVDEARRLRSEAEAASGAVTAAGRAVRAAAALVRPLPAAVERGDEVGVDTTGLAKAWAALAEAVHAAQAEPGGTEPGGLRRLAGDLALATDVIDAAAPVRRHAADELAARDDRWTPLAKRVAAWIDQGRAAASAKPVARDLKAAEAWLKDAHDEIRNERLRPIAERAQATWRMLRHESNVELGAIRLSGTNTSRRLVLDAAVDGSDGNALGVMSQGEVNALALSVFLPRATLPESPFRFVVIDDPVQAMDPAKVEGLARVLHETAQTRQVVVFTHDDRLPGTIRRLGLDARIVQVQRRPESVVEISPAGDPVDRALRDAMSVAAAGAPPEVTAKVVPGLCRAALEAALTEITQRRELAAGRSDAEVEDLLDACKRLTQKAALALFGDADAGDRVLRRLNSIDRRHGDTFQTLNKGAHGAAVRSPRRIVDATRSLIDALQAAARGSGGSRRSGGSQ
jgi:energy-coupling factor transporter ATP-binding protein EcfA2